jgi:hypothetical protein
VRKDDEKGDMKNSTDTSAMIERSAGTESDSQRCSGSWGLLFSKLWDDHNAQVL